MRPEDIKRVCRNAVKPGQKLRFHCTQCGDCCRNREDISLTPYDLFQIAKYLQLRPGEILRRYCTLSIDPSTGLPAVTLKPNKRTHACPFLKNNLCSVQPVKPTMCALFPLGRVVKLGNPGEATREKEIFYILQDVSCGARNEEHTVEEWLAEHDHENGEAWFLEWVDALEKTVPVIQFAELFMPDRLVNELYRVFIRTMYQNYLIRDDFTSQFRENLENLLAFLNKIRRIIEEYKQG
ncbi:MAG: YkgJ family cysteine cluster protein [Oscillospiraceae bacterium]|nr:YkgJ family cysteine cluster protein [Clostridia bacterium]MBR1458933.1 YkgJ family cysteine cluster protein [Oscillospiraceae bacterium]